MAADPGSSIYLYNASGQVKMIGIDRPAIPFGHRHAGAIETQATGAARPDLIGRNRVGGNDVVGNIKYRTIAGCDALQFQHPAAGQNPAHGNTCATCKRLGLLSITYIPLLKFFRECL